MPLTPTLSSKTLAPPVYHTNKPTSDTDIVETVCFDTPNIPSPRRAFFSADFPLTKSLIFCGTNPTGEEFLKLFDQFRNIEDLEFSICTYFDDSVLHSIVQRFSHSLKTINCSSSDGITDVGVIELIEACANLQSLHLEQCPKVTVAVIRTLSSHRPQIQKLYLPQCNIESADSRLFENFTNLRKVNLMGCSKLNPEALALLISQNPHLTHLNLSGCEGIDDNMLGYIPESSELEVIDLSYIQSITDAGIVKLANSCRSLHTLSLSHCSQITGSSIPALLSLSPQILYLSHCQGIKDITWETTQSLKALSLEGCSITDQTSQEIARCCTNLEVLHLSNTRITAASLISLKNLPDLQTLYLSGYVDITYIQLIDILDNWPQIKCISYRNPNDPVDINLLSNRYPNINFE